MAKTTVKELPEKFEYLEAHNLIDQRIGSVLADSYGVFNRSAKREIVKKYRPMCGACFAGHLARFGNTAPRTEPVQNASARYAVLEAFELAGIRKARFHDYRDGIRLLAKILVKGSNFRFWYARHAVSPDVRNISFHAVAEYLHKRCGAPRSCFSFRDWCDTTPSQVLRKMLDLNPEIADIEL